MPRKYVRKPGSRQYRDYTEESLLQAINDCKYESVKNVAERHRIPFCTLYNKVNGQHTKRCGGQTALSTDIEDALVHNLLLCAEYGMPLDKTDLKLIVSSYLNRCGESIAKFENNVPGDDWVKQFISRHEELSDRVCQNIKRARAQVKPAEVRKYFENLQTSLEGVPKGNIINYDETNLADEPGVKKCIFRRGVKYPERIINFSKGNISVMFAGSAEGELLPPFVVYKSKQVWQSWCEGGPQGTRYGRSKSGWMDGANFDEWFLQVIVPWARRREGPKVMVGDNLSSHLSAQVIEKCEELNIRFVLLPPNSTDKCQPLDVSFFGPMKREWRKLMTEYKLKKPTSTSLDKSVFPGLLSKLIDRLGMRVPKNIMSGFSACGISPFNMDCVLKKFPNAENGENEERQAQVSPAVLEYLQQFKYSPGTSHTVRKPRKRLQLEPGKSICAEDLNPSAATTVTTSTNIDAPSTSSATNIDAPSTSAAMATSSNGSSPVASLSLQQAVSHDSDTDSDDSISSYDDSSDEWLPPPKKARNVFANFQ